MPNQANCPERSKEIACLALVGCGVSVHLSPYPYGFVALVWDPVFGSAGSGRVLHDDLLQPISKAVADRPLLPGRATRISGD